MKVCPALSAFHVGIRIDIRAKVVSQAFEKWTFSTDHYAGYAGVEGDSSRCDRRLSAQQASAMLERGFSGRLATVGADGYPYCIPLLYIRMEGEIYVHTGSARGHLRANVER